VARLLASQAQTVTLAVSKVLLTQLLTWGECLMPPRLLVPRILLPPGRYGRLAMTFNDSWSVLSVLSIASVSTVCQCCPLSCVIRLHCSCVICQSLLSCHPSVIAVSCTTHPPLCLPLPGNMSGVSNTATVCPACHCCHPPAITIAVTCQPATHTAHQLPLPSQPSNMLHIPGAAATCHTDPLHLKF